MLETDQRQTVSFAKNILQKRFCFVKYTDYIYKLLFRMLALKIAILMPGIFNKVFTNPEPQ